MYSKMVLNYGYVLDANNIYPLKRFSPQNVALGLLHDAESVMGNNLLQQEIKKTIVSIIVSICGERENLILKGTESVKGLHLKSVLRTRKRKLVKFLIMLSRQAKLLNQLIALNVVKFVNSRRIMMITQTPYKLGGYAMNAILIIRVWVYTFQRVAREG